MQVHCAKHSEQYVWISDYSYNIGTELTGWGRYVHHYWYTLHTDPAHCVLSTYERWLYTWRLKALSDVMPREHIQVAVMLLLFPMQPVSRDTPPGKASPGAPCYISLLTFDISRAMPARILSTTSSFLIFPVRLAHGGSGDEASYHWRGRSMLLSLSLS